MKKSKELKTKILELEEQVRKLRLEYDAAKSTEINEFKNELNEKYSNKYFLVNHYNYHKIGTKIPTGGYSIYYIKKVMNPISDDRMDALADRIKVDFDDRYADPLTHDKNITVSVITERIIQQIYYTDFEKELTKDEVIKIIDNLNNGFIKLTSIIK